MVGGGESAPTAGMLEGKDLAEMGIWERTSSMLSSARRQLGPWLALGGLVLVTALLMRERDWFPPFLASLQYAGALVGRDTLLLLLIGGAAWGWGYVSLLIGGWRQLDAGLHLIAIALGLGILGLFVFVSGLVGWLSLATAIVPLVLGWVGVLVGVIGLGSRRVGWWQYRLPSLGLYEVLLLTICVGSVLYSLIAYAMLPPREWDSVSYHLALPRTYIREGRMVYVPYNVNAHWPSMMQMLYTLSLLLGSDTLAQLVALSMGCMAAIVVFLLGRELHSYRAGLLAAAMYLSHPIFKSYAGTAMVDVPLSFYTVLTVWCVSRWMITRQIPWLVLGGFVGGLAASTKLTGALAPLVAGIFLCVYVIVSSRGKGTANAWRELSWIALFGMIALVVVTPWYVKSYFDTGNPVFPFLYDVLGGRDWDARGDALHTVLWLHLPNLPPSLKSFLIAPWKFTLMQSGMPVLLLAPLSLLVLPQRKTQRRQLVVLVASFSFLYYVFWFSGTHQWRFLTPVLPMLCLLAAYTLERLQELLSQVRMVSVLVQTGVSVALVSSLFVVNPSEMDLVRKTYAYYSGALNRGQFLSYLLPEYAVFDWANEHLPADARVLLAIYETRGYYLERDYVWANPLGQRVIRFEQIEDAMTLRAMLAEMGIHYMIYNPREVFTDYAEWPHIKKLLGDLIADYGDLMFVEPQTGEAVYVLRSP